MAPSSYLEDVPQELLELRQELLRRLPWATSASASDIATGWAQIIDRLDRDLRAVVPGYKLLQVKEKLGGLRYYIDGQRAEAGERADALIDDAEDAALHTCDYCGKPGEMRKIGWLYATRCHRHADSANDAPIIE